MNWGLAKGGLIFTLVCQVIVGIVCFAITVFASSILSTASNALDTAGVGSVGNHIIAGAQAALWVVVAFCVLGIALSSFALYRIGQMEKGNVRFSKGIVIFAGIIAFFTTFIGGIITIIGVATAKDPNEGYLGRRNDYNDSRSQRRDDYNDRWSRRRDDYNDRPQRWEDEGPRRRYR